jgi:hypothetical protein
MTHASRIAAQLRKAEEDGDLPEELRESARARREEIEEQEGDG